MTKYSGDDPYLDPVSRRFNKPPRHRFDLEHLQAIHRYLFQDVYEWAGELRTIEISKGGHLFAHHTHIQSAAHYLGEVNALHPFREGNGRTQREFISHLAAATGYYIAWENVKRDDMLQASIASFKGDISQLAAIIRDNLSPLSATPVLPKAKPAGGASESGPSKVDGSASDGSDLTASIAERVRIEPTAVSSRSVNIE